MENKNIKLNILVTNKSKKNVQYELKYNPGGYSLFSYIIHCFQTQKKESLILFRDKPLDENISYDDLKCEKFETFQLYIFPEASYKDIYKELIKDKGNFDQYYYALIKANGDKEKAYDIAQPDKGFYFNLNEYVKSVDSYEDINCAYSQYDSAHQEDSLSPWQYLKHFGLSDNLFRTKKVREFLNTYDTEFRYKKKVYEYYKFRLKDYEYDTVNKLLEEYFNINLDTPDGDEDDSVNDIIQKKELVLNTYISADKDIDQTRSALNCLT